MRCLLGPGDFELVQFFLFNRDSQFRENLVFSGIYVARGKVHSLDGISGPDEVTEVG